MNGFIPYLHTGDEIGITNLADGIDDSDATNWYKVAEVTERDGQRAYIIEWSDGSRAMSAIRHSQLQHYTYSVRTNIQVIDTSAAMEDVERFLQLIAA